MDRILQNAPTTASVTYYEDGAIVDPGTVTVTITREDGTALYTSAATSGTGAAERDYALTALDTAALDSLKFTWTSSTKGVRVTYVEVVGGFLFSVADARLVKPLDSATIYTTAAVQIARTLAETALENACGIAFVPRYAREVVDGPPGGGTDIVLDHPRPLSVTSATDTALVVDPTTLVLYPSGVVYNPARWSEGRRNISLKLTHGYPFSPPRVGRAALLLAKRFLVDTPISDRATQLVNPDGTTQWFVTAGVRDAVFDIPECNAVIEEYGVRTSVG